MEHTQVCSTVNGKNRRFSRRSTTFVSGTVLEYANRIFSENKDLVNEADFERVVRPMLVARSFLSLQKMISSLTDRDLHDTL